MKKKIKKPNLYLSTKTVTREEEKKRRGEEKNKPTIRKTKTIQGIKNSPFEKNGIKRLDTEHISKNIQKATAKLSTIYEDFEVIAEDIIVEMPSISKEDEKYFDAVDDITKKDDDEKQANIVEQLRKETEKIRENLNIPNDMTITTDRMLSMEEYLQKLFKYKIDYDKRYPENSNYVRHTQDLEGKTSPIQLGSIIRTKNDDPFLEQKIKPSSMLLVQTNIPKNRLSTEELIQLNRKPIIVQPKRNQRKMNLEKDIQLNIHELENMNDARTLKEHRRIKKKFNKEALRRIKLKQLLDNTVTHQPTSPKELTRHLGRSSFQSAILLSQAEVFPREDIPNRDKQVIERDYDGDRMEVDMIDEEILQDEMKDDSKKRRLKKIVKEKERLISKRTKEKKERLALETKEVEIENEFNLSSMYLKKYEFPFTIPDCLSEHQTERMIISSLIDQLDMAAQHLAFLKEEKGAIALEESMLYDRIKKAKQEIERIEKQLRIRKALIRQREKHIRQLSLDNDTLESQLKQQILEEQHQISDIKREALAIEHEVEREKTLFSLKQNELEDSYERALKLKIENAQPILDDILICKEMYDVFDNEMDALLDVTRQRDDYLVDLNQKLDRALIDRNSLYSYLLEMSKERAKEQAPTAADFFSTKSKSKASLLPTVQKIYVGSTTNSIKSGSIQSKIPISFHSEDTRSNSRYSHSENFSQASIHLKSNASLLKTNPTSLSISIDLDDFTPSAPKLKDKSIVKSPTMMAVSKRIRMKNLKKQKSKTYKPTQTDYDAIQIGY